jgi:hypothetical protein
MYGFRDYKVITGTSGTFGNESGGFKYVEVTNDTAGTVNVSFNSYPDQGHNADAIPVKAGTTRNIPLAVYNFTATGSVTVVAYKA